METRCKGAKGAVRGKGLKAHKRYSRHDKQEIVVYDGAMNTRLTPPPPKEVRLTIPVSERVHQTFTRIAKAGNMPVGRSMAEWLEDTVDAAEFMAQKMEEARSAPALVARELHSYALGLSDMTQTLISQAQKVEKGGLPKAAALPPFGIQKRSTPSSNTGGEPQSEKKNLPKKGKS